MKLYAPGACSLSPHIILCEMGEVFSVADAYLFVVLSRRGFIGFDLSPWPVLSAYFDRVLSRPAVQEALRKEGWMD